MSLIETFRNKVKERDNYGCMISLSLWITNFCMIYSLWLFLKYEEFSPSEYSRQNFNVHSLCFVFPCLSLNLTCKEINKLIDSNTDSTKICDKICCNEVCKSFCGSTIESWEKLSDMKNEIVGGYFENGFIIVFFFMIPFFCLFCVSCKKFRDLSKQINILDRELEEIQV